MSVENNTCFWNQFDAGIEGMDALLKAMCYEDIERSLALRVSHDVARALHSSMINAVVRTDDRIALHFATYGRRHVQAAIESQRRSRSGGQTLSLARTHFDLLVMDSDFSWLINGVEDDTILTAACECAQRDLDANAKRSSRYFLLAAAMAMCRNGRIDDASRVMSTLSPAQMTRKSDSSLYASTFEQVLAIIVNELNSPTSKYCQRISEYISHMYATWRSGHVAKLCPTNMIHAIEVSYIASKYFDDWRLKEFTMPNVVRRLRGEIILNSKTQF